MCRPKRDVARLVALWSAGIFVLGTLLGWGAARGEAAASQPPPDEGASAAGAVASSCAQARQRWERASQQIDYELAEANRRLGLFATSNRVRRGELARRYAALYRLVRGGALRFLTEATTPAEFARHAATIRWLVRSQHDELVAGEEEDQRLRRTKERLKETRAQLRAQLAMPGAEPADAAMRAGTFARQRGSLPWPLRGRLRASFGDVVFSPGPQGLRQSGIVLSVIGSPRVRAVSRGTVVVAATIPGQGRVVVIDHDDGYHSVYASLAEIKVVRGARVISGGVLGTAGPCPLRAVGPRQLYFELRHVQTALDPARWLVAR